MRAPASRRGSDLPSTPAYPSSGRAASRHLGAALLALLLVALLVAPAGADDAAARFREDIRRLEQQQAAVREEAERLAREQRRVRAEQERIAGELQAATDRLAELEAELATLIDEEARAAAEVADLAERQGQQRQQLSDRVRALYRLGGVDPMLLLLSGRSTDEVVEKSHYVAALTNKDHTVLEAYQATTTRLQRRQRDLGDARAEVALLRGRVDAARAELSRRMDEATAAEDRLVELQRQARANIAALEEREQDRRAQEEERLAALARQRAEQERRRAEEQRRAEAEQQRRAASQERASRSTASSTRSRGGSGGGSGSSGGGRGGMACPQAQPRSFTNDWGAARSGGRRHQGTDIFGRMGGNVYAITSGVIQFTKTGASAGLFLSLRGDDGHTYWYMHLSGFAVSAGQRVSAGQVVGYNGNTGNARGATPHIHFEYHPGGGGPTNPYPLLRSIC